MARITWKKVDNAPCCPGEILADDGRSVLIQLDTDYPGVATTFGWSTRNVQVQNTGYYGIKPCDHDATDGTIDCPDCGLRAITFINAAYKYLRENYDAQADDPGYFGC